jgi:hypothetical protein
MTTLGALSWTHSSPTHRQAPPAGYSTLMQVVGWLRLSGDSPRARHAPANSVDSGPRVLGMVRARTCVYCLALPR